MTRHHKRQYRRTQWTRIVVAMTTSTESTQTHGTGSAATIPTETVIDVRGLRCSYGDFEAVKGIDLEVHRGELFALLGTNGAGKTTTLETLEGHRTASNGQVQVLGMNPRQHRRKLATRIGVMFQHAGLMEDLTAAENLKTWCGLQGATTDPGQLLEQVALDHRSDVPIKNLSGGERRRLELAVAITNEPDLVFLDEPTTGMDPEARVRTWEIVRDLLRRGITVVLTTHYLEEAERLADRLAIMHEGEIAVAGTLAEVLATRPGRISCRIDGELPADLPGFLGDARTDVARDRLQLTIASRELQTDMYRLLDWADQHRVTLHQLSGAEASLSEIFHDIATPTSTPKEHN